MTDMRVHRTVWRWHPYAGLIVAPFSLILSVKGAIHLFNDELNDLAMPARGSAHWRTRVAGRPRAAGRAAARRPRA
ncbi:PepSY domain-containing protein [uncultured Sphingomonas sp.]|uniref:PepSY domain-containing protein n=1 Tax=uncultured Sphingomonas sp. TaxID=158754 RepID=UPI0035CC7ECC